ncbi:hypothetical protein N7468_010545 [Penicillium chermesinum]|uniref:MT-A70-domain-containing protein n=1 Tax=Penicillium chermesinum TaxID=63820 RepID=A0A9W9TA03_9EURO|nr:uncharacterized protein N7468_010545 [Penicillium chermesinum]KAJ5214866.1 hypothetical protein N7468_010545 [Penicillium chermesinum]
MTGGLGPHVLYANPDCTVFVLDLPYSIAQAQELCVKTIRAQEFSPATGSVELAKGIAGYPLSKSALEESHPSPSEPKSEAARQRLLARIPPTELETHEYQTTIIEPRVQVSLDSIYSEYGVNSEDRSRSPKWILPRLIFDDMPENEQLDTGAYRLFSRHRNGVPPTILSSSGTTRFNSIFDLTGVVKNPFTEAVKLFIDGDQDRQEPSALRDYRFNLILMDPPWPNRSVRRSQAYQVAAYTDIEALKQRLKDILQAHACQAPARQSMPVHGPQPIVSIPSNQPSQESFAAIWITGSHKTRAVAYETLRSSGFKLHEEWIWVKITAHGKPVGPVDGLWRKPYEILVIGKKDQEAERNRVFPGNCTTPALGIAGVDVSTIPKRVIAAAPDFHSRKPSLKSLFERYLFGLDPAGQQAPTEFYSALEVFARHLTAGWWACGNEVMKFNHCDYWVEDNGSVL